MPKNRSGILEVSLFNLRDVPVRTLRYRKESTKSTALEAWCHSLKHAATRGLQPSKFTEQGVNRACVRYDSLADRMTSEARIEALGIGG